MHPIHGRRAQAGFSIKRVLSLVLTVVLLGFWAVRHANFVLGRSLYMAFPADDTTYRAAWPSLTGRISAKDVVFPSAEGTGLREFRFDEVRVEVPMGQYLLSALSRRGRLNAISDVRITLSGGRGEYGLPFTGSLGVFGAASSAPFEAEGCVGDSLWTSDELADMGLKAGPTELILEFKREKGRLTLTQTQRTPGVASVRYHGVLEMNDDYSLFSLRDSGRNALLSDSWSVQDEGFVAARNRYCARKDKITPEQFVQRHVATVQRLLAADGLHANEAMAAAYRQFASHGGSLEFSVDYDPPLTAERYAETHFGDWVGQMRGRFSVDSKPQVFGLESRTPLPLPEDDEGAEAQRTVFDVLRAEGGDPLQGAADAAVATLQQGAETTTVAAVGVAPAPAVTTIAAAASATAPKPATAATAAAAAKPAAAPEPKALVVVPAAHTTVVSSAGRIDANQAAAGAAPITAGTRVTYAQLGKMVGQNARVFLKTRPPMQGQVVREDKGVVYLRRHLGSGYAVLEIDPKAFDYAEAVR